MAKKEPRKTAYLYDTPVENIFIGEYLPEMPGDFVKVYLYGLMESEGGREESCAEEEARIAKMLHMSADDVAHAFACLEEYGLVERLGDRRRFLRMKERLFGRKEEQRPEASRSREMLSEENYARLMDNKAIGDMISAVQQLLGRFLGPEEQESILSWIQELNIQPDLVTRAYEYSKERGVDNSRYVGKVLLGWARHGITSRVEAEEYLADRDERHHLYKQVLLEIGQNRIPSEAERRIIDRWVDEYGCSLSEIKDACGETTKISSPNISYVDAVIRNRKGVAPTPEKMPRSKVMEYYETLRRQAEDRARQAEEEIYLRIPRVREIDEQHRESTRTLTRLILSAEPDRNERLARLREEMEGLQKEKARLLTEHDIPIDYAVPHYRCGKCGDTGLLESGNLCSCYMEVAEEAAAHWNEEKK